MEAFDQIPWASVVMVLEARAERISEEEGQLPSEEESSAIRQITDGAWGIGLG